MNLSYAITLSVFLAAYIIISGFLCFIEPYSEKSLKIIIAEYASYNNRTTVTTIDTVQNLAFNDVSNKRNNLLLNLPTSEATNIALNDDSQPQQILVQQQQQQQQYQQQQTSVNFNYAAKNRFISRYHILKSKKI